MAIFTSRDREATLARLLELGEADHRLDAAVLTGSLGAATADRWSDIDLSFLVKDNASCEQTAADWVELCCAELTVAHHYATAFGATLVRGLLLENGLVADLAFTSSEEFSVWAKVRVMFDHSGRATRVAQSPNTWAPTPDWSGEAGFGWHDVLHACVAANRGRPWQSLFYLQRVRNRALALASERHGLEAEEFKHVDDLPPPEREPFLASLVSRLDQTSLLDAIEIATRGFLGEFERGDPSLAARLRGPLLAFIAASRQPPSAGESGPPDGTVTAVT